MHVQVDCLQIERFFFFPQDDISVNEPDKEFCLIKPQHFFTRLSNLYASFYKSFLLLQTTCAALNIPGMR